MQNSLPSKKLTAVSLFSGAGGLDVGFEAAGFSVLLANEFDHDAAETWKANRPGNEHAMVEGDINLLLPQLEKLRGKVDIVFGGPPCQGFSVAGKMDPNDPRNSLVLSFLEAVRIIRPKCFLLENVKALGKLAKWESVRKEIIDRAEGMGYQVTYKVQIASDFNVPQNRERVFFIGVRESENSFDTFYDNLEKLKQKGPTVRSVLNALGAIGTEENPETCTAKISLANKPVMRVSPYAGMLVNGAGRPINLDAYAPTLPAAMGGNKTPIIDEMALKDASLANWFVQYHKRLTEGTTSPSKEKVPTYVRRLSVSEAAALQTFPRNYVYCGPKGKHYRQIGNAVPCKLAEAMALAIKETFFKI